MSDYAFTSVAPALRQYFLYVLAQSEAGSIPVSHDDIIRATRLSGDSDSLIARIDIGRCLDGLSELERDALQIEYTCEILPAYHPRETCKVRLLEAKCGERMTESKYQVIVMQATEWVRVKLEDRGWIPRRTYVAPAFNRLRRVGNRYADSAP